MSKQRRGALFIVLGALLLVSCGSGKRGGGFDEVLLPGTGTVEFGIKKDEHRWQFVSSEGFPKEQIVLEECPNVITQITPSLPKSVVVKDYGYRISTSDIFDVYLGLESGGPNMPIPPSESESEESAEEPEEMKDTEPDIIAFKDNYFFNLNRYIGVVISDISDEQRTYIEHIIPLDGYPIEMFLAGRYMILGVAGYIYYDYYYVPQDEVFAEPLETPSSIQVWDVKRPDDASLLSKVEIKGSLVQLLRHSDVVIALSVTPDEVYVTSVELLEDGGLDKKSEFEFSVGEEDYFAFYYNLRYSRMVVKDNTLVVGVIDNSLRCVGDSYCYPSFNDTVLHVFTITDNGSLTERGTVTIKGVMDDERRMDIKDGILRVISGERWGGSAYAVTVDLSEVEVLDTEVISTSERLYATAFSGDVGYAVTLRRIDPLFVIDFSNPKSIKVLGQLEVLGWAEQLYPYGDRLLALGPEGRLTALSLYNVSEYKNPSLIARLYFGEISSASEVYNDYRAFTFLPDMNLILFPYTERRWWIPVDDYIQIVDYFPESLTARGKVKHHGVVRRVVPLSENKFIAVSEKTLSILDISDRDAPHTVSELRLVRNVKQIVGDRDIAFLLVDSNRSPYSYYYYPEGLTPYYRYELVDVGDPVMKPLAEVLSHEPIRWVHKVDAERFIVKTAGNSDTTFYRLVLKNKGVSVNECIAVDNFVSTEGVSYSGNYIIQPGIVSLDMGGPYVCLLFFAPPISSQTRSVVGYPCYPYGMWNGDFVTLFIDAEGMNLNHSIFVEGITSYSYERSTTDYTYGVTSVIGFLGADSQSLYFSAVNVEMHSNSYNWFIYPYVIKLDVSALPSFTKEVVNVPEIPEFKLGEGGFLTRGGDTISVYELTSTGPVLLHQIMDEMVSSNVYLTENYILHTGYSPDNWDFVVESYALTEDGFEKVSSVSLSGVYYYDWCLWSNFFLPLECEGIKRTGGDYIILDHILQFRDPYAIRKNKYCLDYSTCRGTIYGSLLLRADNLSLENAIPIRTTLYNTSLFYTGKKLLVPRGFMGMDVIE